MLVSAGNDQDEYGFDRGSRKSYQLDIGCELGTLQKVHVQQVCCPILSGSAQTWRSGVVDSPMWAGACIMSATAEISLVLSVGMAITPTLSASCEALCFTSY